MTDRFVSAAELMSQALGMPDYRFVIVGHPISSASDDALSQYARMTIAQAPLLLLQG
jgi:hypothetical protein